jgi:TM2 domain-containing membrane protein YozV
MDCVNHSGIQAVAYCQSCGKALCTGCVRNLGAGQIFCETCGMAWKGLQPPYAVPPVSEGPSPAVAAVLGLIPGVGAMYNGQLMKGLSHIVIFVILVGITDHFPLCGLFIAAWIFYQAFEAYHTAKAMRDGLPLPDPLGLNELGNRINPCKSRGAQSSEAALPEEDPYAAPNAQGQGTKDLAEKNFPAPYAWREQQSSGDAPYEPSFPPPGAGGPPVYPPPMPPPCRWRRAPVGAIVLIVLGVLFLLGQLDILSGRMLQFVWPVALICLGLWLIIRRIGDAEGGRK